MVQIVACFFTLNSNENDQPLHWLNTSTRQPLEPLSLPHCRSSMKYHLWSILGIPSYADSVNVTPYAARAIRVECSSFPYPNQGKKHPPYCTREMREGLGWTWHPDTLHYGVQRQEKDGNGSCPKCSGQYEAWWEDKICLKLISPISNSKVKRMSTSFVVVLIWGRVWTPQLHHKHGNKLEDDCGLKGTQADIKARSHYKVIYGRCSHCSQVPTANSNSSFTANHTINLYHRTSVHANIGHTPTHI